MARYHLHMKVPSGFNGGKTGNLIEAPTLAGYVPDMFCRIPVVLVFIGGITSTLAGDATIRGRLLDVADGAPVADVGVKVYAPALGPNLWSAQGEIFKSLTDAQGRFAIDVPGNGLQLWVLAEGSGGTALRSVISGETGEFELRIRRELPTGKLAGRILDQDGSPAADLEIELVGEYSVRRKTRTDRNGAFQLTELPSFGQGVLLASNKSTVLPQILVHTDQQPVELQLVPGATLSGTALENISRLPVAGIKVSVRPAFSSGYSLWTTSNSNGEWLLKEIPTGEYVMEVSGPHHFETISDARPRPLRLGIGSTNSLNLLLSRKATLTGEVLGRDGEPIGGALVAVPTTPGGETGETAWVRTTSEGRFTIHTGRLNARMQLSVFDSMSGLRLVWIEPLVAGESRRISVPALRGSVRVRGVVVDEAGSGIDGIRINPPAWISASMPVSSNDGGRFDLGRLPLSEASEEFPIGSQAPRPAYAGMRRDPADRIWRTMAQLVEGRSFYIDRNMSFRAEHNQIPDVKITLKPAQLVVLRGRLAEGNGQAPINGQVFLFRGTANEKWAQHALPKLMGGGMIVLENDGRLLGGTECGADGSFAIYALRNDGEETPNGTRFSLGVASNGQPRHLLTQLFIPRDANALPLEIIKLPAAAKIPAAPAPGERPVPIPPIRVL